MKRLSLFAAALAALTVPSNADAALFFLFDRPQAAPNDRATVRTGNTPRDFALSQRVKPFQRPIRLYLVPVGLASQVHSRFDSRLHFVGVIVPDRNGRGFVRFSVPPIDAKTYTIAYWCPGCAAFSRGRTFFVQRPNQFVPRYRSQARLRVARTQACPVTLPNGNRPLGWPRNASWHGNGLLWTKIPVAGVYSVPPDRLGADGSIGNKLLWVTTPLWRAPVLSGERLDAPAPQLAVDRANRGSSSFMTPVSFPTAGCWRVRARVGDLSLTYVVSVVVAEVVTSAVSGASCPAAPVHYGVSWESPRDVAPWVAAGPGPRRIIGLLYTYDNMLADARVRLAPGVVLYAGRMAKIGWVPRKWSHGWGRYLTVEGQRLDGPGRLRARFRRAVAPQFYPTGVTVPSVGCWRLTLRSGRRSVALVVQAIEPPPEPRCDLSEVRPGGIAATPASSRIVAGWQWQTADGGALMYTGGKTPEGGDTKVLWRVARSPAESTIRLFGNEIGGPGTFARTWPAATSEPGAFPSTVIVPSPGCWLLTVRSGGIGGVIVFRAVAP